MTITREWRGDSGPTIFSSTEPLFFLLLPRLSDCVALPGVLGHVKCDKRLMHALFRSTMIEADVCIVGAGIMGSAAAYWLSKNPSLKTILIDQYSLLNSYCSSNDANRVFRYSYGANVFYTKMAVESRRLWVSLEKETGESLLAPSGLLMLMGEDENSNNFNKSSYRTLTQSKLGAEWLEARDMKRRFPQFASTEAVFDPNAGTLLASKCLSLLSSRARESGVQILDNTHVTSIASDSSVIIQTKNASDVKCGAAVIAAGPWSNPLRRENMVEITSTRQQVVYFNPETRISNYRSPKFPVFFADQYYGLPAAGIEGVKVSHKGVWTPVDPSEAERTVDPATVEECRKVCQRFVPELADKPVLSTKVCLYDMTKDSDFVIGRDPKHASIVYGYGFSGHGFKFATLIGKLLAELAVGEQNSFDIARFSPSRIPVSPVLPVA